MVAETIMRPVRHFACDNTHTAHGTRHTAHGTRYTAHDTRPTSTKVQTFEKKAVEDAEHGLEGEAANKKARKPLGKHPGEIHLQFPHVCRNQTTKGKQ